MIQQMVTGLAPERPASASEKPAEPGVGGDEALADCSAVHSAASVVSLTAAVAVERIRQRG